MGRGALELTHLREAAVYDVRLWSTRLILVLQIVDMASFVDIIM